jgi:hypothetical protein
MKINELCNELGEYFEKTKGNGVLATSDDKGNVDVAIYARPHVFEGDKVAFIMADRLSHKNLQSNPQAAYLFAEEGGHYTGRRLYLTMVNEEKDSKKIYELMRRKDKKSAEAYKEVDKFLVYFRIDRVLPLVGDDIQCF